MAKHMSKLGRILDEFRPQCYESEFTLFLRELKLQRPQIETEQRKSRAIWWDRKQDADTLARDKASRVAQQAYVYQNKV